MCVKSKKKPHWPWWGSSCFCPASLMAWSPPLPLSCDLCTGAGTIAFPPCDRKGTRHRRSPSCLHKENCLLFAFNSCLKIEKWAIPVNKTKLDFRHDIFLFKKISRFMKCITLSLVKTSNWIGENRISKIPPVENLNPNF